MSDDAERHSGAVHRRDLAQLVRLVLALAVAAAVVLLALDNREDTRVGYVWDDATMPLWMLIVASAVGGVVVAALVRFRSRHRRA